MRMSETKVEYEPGECPLSSDGICESEGECPHGCDAKLRALSAAADDREEQRAANDRVFLLLIALRCAAWTKKLSALNAPASVLQVWEDKRVRLVKYTTAWTETEFNRHWKAYWADFSGQEYGVLHLNDVWLEKLYWLYYPPTHDGNPN